MFVSQREGRGAFFVTAITLFRQQDKRLCLPVEVLHQGCVCENSCKTIVISAYYRAASLILMHSDFSHMEEWQRVRSIGIC